MYLVLTASKDTYVTDKIINNDFRATDANVGRAATIDIFKLWQESTFMSGSTRVSSSVQELSRGFIKFDYQRLHDLTSSILDISDPSFKCKLKMYDMMGGQATPVNFSIVLFPLSRSFDEGLGRDVVSFSDIGESNFVTASYSSGEPNLWFVSGANASGSTLTVFEDQIMMFQLNQGGHAFAIRTGINPPSSLTGTNLTSSNGGNNLIHIATDGTVTSGTSANGKTSGTLIWKVPHFGSNQASTYYYQCTAHPASMYGLIKIRTITY